MQTYQLLTDAVVRKIYPDVEPFAHQRKGCSADYIIGGEYCLEVKFDFRASQTGNIFVEYATKRNDITRESGITLSAKNNYKVLYLLDNKVDVAAYELFAKELLEIAEDKGATAETRAYVNGNRPGFSSLGYKLKIEYLKDFFKCRVKL